MFDDGINNEFELAHQKGLTRGFDLGWSYKGRFDRQIIKDHINMLDGQFQRAPNPQARLSIISQKDVLRLVMTIMKEHSANRENITYNSW